ncbi:MAG: hypothetical protein DSZ09_03645 [Sulfurovum sp.]|nr:MAG: hypothetical protein DSZ08_07830 [Sulfurovum sp.]RUM71007.1 MAG: hypothetical protein DSZ09_03645 [Sulfurovum sp.]RUM74080.1 MAG: hypothetical protein DSZ12_06125 [Sulfurovum sp.]
MSRIFVLFLFLFTSAFSRDVDEFPFIGVNISIHDMTIASVKDDPTFSTFGIRYGRQTVDWRTMLTYSMGNDYDSFSLEVDMFLLDKLFGTSTFRPYLGLSAGTLKYNNKELKKVLEDKAKADRLKNKTKNSENNTTIDVDTSGYYYGLNVGLTIYATDNIDADVGYYYNFVEDFVNVDHTQGVNFSLHYFY